MSIKRIRTVSRIVKFNCKFGAWHVKFVGDIWFVFIFNDYHYLLVTTQ